MTQQEIRSELIRILANNADMPEHTVDDIITLFIPGYEMPLCAKCNLKVINEDFTYDGEDLIVHKQCL